MKAYLDLIKKVMDDGVDRPDRTGTGTRSIFGEQLRFDLNRGFPAVTTKKLAWKAMVSELLWFIEGSGDEKRLKEILHGDRESPKKTIWTDNAEAPYWKPKAKFEGDLGRVYGTQWRDFRTYVKVDGGNRNGKDIFVAGKAVDQVAELISGLQADPYGRRHILTAWNPGEMDQLALPPCHMMAQFFVAPLSVKEIQETYQDWYHDKNHLERKVIDVDRNGLSRASRLKTVDDLHDVGLPTQKLSCQMYQRSVDVALGLPFNIASYSLLVHMLAQVCGYRVGEFVWVGGDVHVYHNHFDGVAEQMKRAPLPLPKLWINPTVTNILDFTMDDFRLDDYQHHSTIAMKMAV